MNALNNNNIIGEDLSRYNEIHSKKWKKFRKEKECKNCEDNDYNHNSQKRIKAFENKFIFILKKSKENKEEEKLRKNKEDIQDNEELKKVEKHIDNNNGEDKEKEKKYERIRQKYSQDLDMNLKKQLFWII